MEKDGWKAVAAVTTMALVAIVFYFVVFAADAQCAECDTDEPYNSGYLRGIRDVFDDAYTNGITMIPFNDTHSMALIPWSKD